MFEVFKNTFTKNYFNFKGRARRKEYWLFVLSVIVLGIILGVAFGILGFSDNAIDAISSLLYIVVLIPELALIARRLHDINLSAWWLLLLLTGIGSIVIIIFCLIPGTVGPNKYGLDPKAEDRLPSAY